MPLTQAEQDAEHLRLLSIFHYVVAGMQALFASFPIIHLAIGLGMVFFPDKMEGGKGGLPPAFIGWFFVAFAGAWIVFGWTLAVCMVVAGRSLRQRKRYIFCLVTAGVGAAICMPFGTVLGVFTIIVLMRPSVKESFQGAAGAS
jgi:hypothetical protein